MALPEDIIYIGFNQDSSCITLSTEIISENHHEHSFRVINSSPLKYCFQRGK